MLPPYHLQCCLNLYHPCHAQNPALRHELSFEMGQVHSDIDLHFDNDDDAGGPIPVLPREGLKGPEWHLKSSSKMSPR